MEKTSEIRVYLNIHKIMSIISNYCPISRIVFLDNKLLSKIKVQKTSVYYLIPFLL